MNKKRVRKDGKAWHNNIGPWYETLKAEQRRQLAEKSRTRTVGAEEGEADKG